MTEIQIAGLVGLSNALLSALQAYFDSTTTDSDNPSGGAQQQGGVVAEVAALTALVNAVAPMIAEAAEDGGLAEGLGAFGGLGLIPFSGAAALLGGGLSAAAYYGDVQKWQDNPNADTTAALLGDIFGIAAAAMAAAALFPEITVPALAISDALLLLQMIANGNLQKTAGMIGGGASKIADVVGAMFQKAMFGSGRDPLLVDIGEGIQTGDPSDGTSFDFSNDGVKVQTSWPTATTGILVVDNGTPVTSGAQLFGDATALPDGKQASDGFQALTALDSNGDGVIDAKDSAYATLGIWVDANQDGIAQAGEIKTLAELGITSISLDPTPLYRHLDGGSVEVSQATVTWADGHTSTIGEAGLFDVSFNSTFTTSISISGTAATLPYVDGSGQVRDTQQAASVSADFAQYLQQYSTATTRAQQLAMLSTLLDKWAATSDFKSQTESNTFAADSDNYQYEFAGVQQYTWQSGPNDTSLANAPSTDGALLASATFFYVGPEWKVGSEQTAEYTKWSDMTSVLEVFNGQTLTDGSWFLAGGSHSYLLPSFAGNVMVGSQDLLPGGDPIYGSEDPFTAGTIFIDGNTYQGGQLVASDGQPSSDTGIAGYSSGDFVFSGSGTPGALSPWLPSARLWDVAVSASQMADIQSAYDELEKSVYGSLLLQTRLAKYFAAVSTSTNDDGSQTVDVSGLNTLLDANLASDPVNTTVDFIELAQYGSSQLDAIGYDWTAKLASVVSESQVDGTWDSVLALLEESLNVQTVSTAADGSQTVTGTDLDEFGLIIGSASTSTLVAGDGADALLISGPGSETLDGSRGDNENFVGVGSDVMIGGSGATVMRAGSGPSTLDASRSQTAVLYGGDGNDVFTGGLISEIATGNGNDTVNTVADSTIAVEGGDGNDLFYISGYSAATITTGNGSNSIYLRDGSSASVTLGAGVDSVFLEEFSSATPSIIRAGAGHDTVAIETQAIAELAQIYAGSGSLTLNGEVNEASLYYSVGDGDVTVDVSGLTAGSSLIGLIFGAGIESSDVMAQRLGDNLELVVGGASHTILFRNWFGAVGAQFDSLQFSDGTVGNATTVMDALSASGGALVRWNNVVGTEGNDTLSGSGVADVFDGDGGSDLAIASGHNDTFVFNAGYANLEIHDVDPTPGDVNVLDLGPGISASSIAVRGDSSGDLYLTDGVEGDQIKIDGMLSSAYDGVQKLVFADGTTLSAAQLIRMETTGSTGSDTLYGSRAANVFDGNGGGDLEIANGDNDTFVFDVGYGNLEIHEEDFAQGDANVLKLGPGISAINIAVTGDASGNLYVTDGVTGDRIQLDGTLSSQYEGVQQVQFADGGTLAIAQLIQMETTGTAGDDTLYGSNTANVFDGKGGSDVAVGGGGNDTFEFAAGDGSLEISETDYAPGDLNILELGASISPSSVVVTADSDGNVYITDNVSGDRIKIDWMMGASGALSAWYGVQQVQFSDGTVWTAQQVVQMAHQVTGTAGPDILSGSYGGEDVFDGKGGSDKEEGEGHGDTFVFNAGYGRLEISEADYTSGDINVLKLGPGILSSSAVVSADSDGNVYITDGTSGDRIEIDWLMRGVGTSTAYYGVQEVQFADGTIWTAPQIAEKAHHVVGTTGADTLAGTYGGADVFDGEGGNDLEVARNNNDTFVFNAGYGSLEIDEEDFASGDLNVLELGTGISLSALNVVGDSAGNLYIADGVAGDRIKIDAMLSSQFEGVQEVGFADGTTLTAAQLIEMETTGGSGNDMLYGSTRADVFDGKGGNDTAVGGGGNDTFVFNAGYGDLEISEADYTSGDINVLKLGAGVSPSSTLVTADSDGNVYLTDGMTGDRIKLDWMISSSGTVSSWYGVQQVRFSDGTVWTAQQVVQMAHQVSGTTGADTLSGTYGGGDVFDGKGGGDTETGEGHNDTFVFDAGYGSLEVNEADYASGDVNVLELGVGISVSSLTVRVAPNGDDIILTDGITGDQVILEYMNEESGAGVQEVSFADGTIWTREQLLQMAAQDGSSNAIIGTSGADTLRGTSGADIFDGAGGNDYEIGNSGSDTFVFKQGYGKLEVYESISGASSPVLQLGSGISASSLHVTKTSDGSGLVIADGFTGDQITLDEMASSRGYGIAEVEFADGSTMSAADLVALSASVITGTPGADTLNGTSSNDYFDGLGGSDSIVGNGGGDTFVFDQNYGHLTINETDYSGDSDILKFGAGVTEASLSVALSGSDIAITDGIAGDVVTLIGMGSSFWSSSTGITGIDFADGSTLSAQQLETLAHTFDGSTGNDTLNGSSIADYFDGHGGTDSIVGNGGNDTFVFNEGYGKLTINEADYNTSDVNVLRLGSGITLQSLTVKASSNRSDLVLMDGIAGDQIILSNVLGTGNSQYGVQQVQFADGTTLSKTQLLQLETTGTSGNDTLVGTSSGELFDGRGGADVAYGNGGGDTFFFNSGYGSLQVNETDYNEGTDIVQLGTGITESELSASISGSDLVLRDGLSGDAVTLVGMGTSYWEPNSGSGISAVRFADGTALSAQQIETMAHTLIGTAGNDTLNGTSIADYFDGHGGSDSVIGGGGNDTFIFDAGYGHLTINENDYTASDINVLKLGAGITAQSLSVSASADRSSLVISDGVAGDQVTLYDMLNSSTYGIQEVAFSDGSTLTAAQLVQMAATGTTGSDTLVGTAANQVFDGRGGNDTVYGNGGNDTYTLDAGYGTLTINNGGYVNNSALGTLDVGGAAPTSIWFQQVGSDLQVDIMGTSTKAIIKNWASGSSYQLSAIESTNASGTNVVDSQLQQLIQAMATYSAGNSGFDPTSTQNSQITDPTVLAAVSSAWHAVA